MNKVFLNGKAVNDYSKLRQYRLTLSGDNNILKLNDFKGHAIVYISIDGDNSFFEIGKGNIINNDLSINYWNTADQRVNNSSIIIGNDNFFNGSNNVIISPLHTKVLIGDDNLFAGSIAIWGRNDHIVYDINTRQRLNLDKDIFIGDKNWIGQNTTFLPGGLVSSNSVVGYGSLINKRFIKNNVLIAGVPAEIKREEINWSRASSYSHIDFENNLNIFN